jgi:rhodanese-related sulfurtransferase
MGRLPRSPADPVSPRPPPGLGHPLVQAAILVVAGAVLGTLVNGLRPGGISLAHPIAAAAGTTAASCEVPVAAVHDVDIAEACALEAAGAAFVDARPAAAYAAGHVAGAIHLPSRGDCPGFEEALARIRAAPTVVVYDDDGSCALARHLADRLVARGLPDVRVMTGGFAGWCAADRPAEAGSCGACARHAGTENE